MNDQGIIRYNSECNLIYKMKNDNFEKEVLTALKKDKFAKQILNNISNYSSFKEWTDLLLFNELIYVLNVLHCKLVSKTHFTAINRH